MADFSYNADGAVATAFFSDDDFVRGLRGPVGSGKTVCGCIEIFRRAIAQEKAADGYRKTRWAVIRNTQPQLKTTTIKTWLDWFPEHTYGKFNWAPPFTHHIKRGEIDCEVLFLALDKPEDVKKLLSLELTGAFVNEAREIPKTIIDGVTMRVGRYPSKRDGGPTWSGMFMDTNAPDEDHWWAIMSGEVPIPEWISDAEAAQLVKPKEWKFYSQPGAMKAIKNNDGGITGYVMNEARENQVGIDDEYYERMINGKTHNWINVYVLNRYGSITDGKPVYPNFDRELHVAKEQLPRFEVETTYIGIDFGLTPAAVFIQNFRGIWYIMKELVAADMGATKFAQVLKKEMNMWGGNFSVWGDPTGDQRVQTDKDTPFRVLRANEIAAQPTHTNDPSIRIDAVNASLVRLVDKRPGMQINPSCINIIKGFEGGYHYRRLNVSGMEKYEESPHKNRFSHPHDAAQYAFLGGGEGRKLMQTANPSKVVTKRQNWDVFQRQGSVKRRKPQIENWS